LSICFPWILLSGVFGMAALATNTQQPIVFFLQFSRDQMSFPDIQTGFQVLPDFGNNKKPPAEWLVVVG